MGDKLLHWCFEKEICIKCGAINTKEFGFDRWAIKNTVQKFVFVHYTGLDCCYTITSLFEVQPWRCPGGKWSSASWGHWGLFCTKPGWQSFLLVPKQTKKTKQIKTAFRQLKPRPVPATFLTNREGGERSYNTVFRHYYKKKRYPFWNTCLTFF